MLPFTVKPAIRTGEAVVTVMVLASVPLLLWDMVKDPFSPDAWLLLVLASGFIWMAWHTNKTSKAYPWRAITVNRDVVVYVTKTQEERQESHLFYVGQKGPETYLVHADPLYTVLLPGRFHKAEAAEQLAKELGISCFAGDSAPDFPVIDKPNRAN